MITGGTGEREESNTQQHKKQTHNFCHFDAPFHAHCSHYMFFRLPVKENQGQIVAPQLQGDSAPKPRRLSAGKERFRRSGAATFGKAPAALRRLKFSTPDK
jgi:hypothetical protein